MYLREGDAKWSDGTGPAAAQTCLLAPAPAESPAAPAAAGKPLPMIRLHGVDLHALTERECIDHIIRRLEAGRGGVVVTPNLDHLRRCRRDLSFAALLAEADLVVADGMPLVWASRLQGTPLPQRVAGSDLISTLSAAAAQHGRSIFLLGGDAGTAQAAARILQDGYPKLKIAGFYCPRVGFERDKKQIAEIEQALKQARPDIVYVALGSPKQERLAGQLRGHLPRAWWLGVGISFSFLCGDVKRAPPWMRRSGLEWLHRLGQEPRRLFKRYLVLGLPFAAVMLGRAAGRGIGQRLGWIELRQGDDRLDADGIQDASPAPALEDATLGEASGAAEAASGAGVAVGVSTPPCVQPGEPAALSGLSRLRGLLLMAGSVRPTRLSTVLGRSLLDLPIDSRHTLLTYWLEQAAAVARLAGLEKLPVRVLVDRNAIEPGSGGRFAGAFTVERDLSDYRGTGGLLANVAVDYADDDLILVSNAAQLLLDPLATVVGRLQATGGVVGLISHRDGTPSGMMLITCKALRLIPPVGFVDMKEQALPAIAARHEVRVCHCQRPTGLPVRSLSDYVTALRAHHRPDGAPLSAADPMAEDWRPTFVLSEAGATVAASARVHDSVILSGGTVEAGAVVVRSVIAPGGIVRRDQKVADQVVVHAVETARRHTGTKARRLVGV